MMGWDGMGLAVTLRGRDDIPATTRATLGTYLRMRRYTRSGILGTQGASLVW